LIKLACSILGSLSNTEVQIDGLSRDGKPYESFALFQKELKTHYMNEVTTKICGAFGPSILFLARMGSKLFL